MELSKLTLTDFISTLSSDAPTPGGGSASALAGAVGAGLTAMVASLTLGREKYKEHEKTAKEAAERIGELRAELIAAIDRDAKAYNGVSEALTMPRGTEGEKAERKRAIQQALKAAVEPPLDIMRHSLAALKCTESLLGRSNPNASSDLGVAALNLKSALEGAWLNVLINLASIEDDRFTAEYRQKAKDILDAGRSLSESIYTEVEREFYSY